MTYPTKKLGDDIAWHKGDILEGADRRKKAARHYIIALEDYHPGNFVGAMLTSKDTYPENILMKPEHIRTHADDGTNFKFQFRDTYFVKSRFIKLENWAPYTKVGELTREGLNLVETETRDLKPELWDEYVARRRKHKN